MPEFLNKYKVHLFFAIIIVVELNWILNSNGFYFIDDSCHFNYNKHLLVSYKESIGLWHRIGRVWLFALPAQFGLKGVQLFSALIFLLTIFFAYRILKQKDVKYAEWVILLIGFQPVLFNISFTVLAELPAAFLIVLSFYFYLKDRHRIVMILSSLIFLFRVEYFYVAVIFSFVYLFRNPAKGGALLFIFAGPLIWFLADWIIRGEYWRFHYDFLYYSNLPKITQGIDWYHYLFYSPVIFGIIQCIFFLVACAIPDLRGAERRGNPVNGDPDLRGAKRRGNPINGHKYSDYAVLLAIVLAGCLVQTILASKIFNLSSSIGQLRYLAVIGPVFGIIAAAGLSSLFVSLKNKYIRVPVMTVVLLILFFQGPFTVPFHRKLEIEKVSEQIVALADKSYPGCNILSNLQYIANVLDEPVSGGDRFCALTSRKLDSCTGALVVWVRELEESPFIKDNVTLGQLEKSPDLKLIESFRDTVNHRSDIPVSKFRKENSEFSRKLFDYLTFDQNCWEDFDIKVFVKDLTPGKSASFLK